MGEFSGNWKLKIILVLTLVVLSSLAVRAGQVSEYISEFSVDAETCSVDNFFKYYIPTPSFFDSSKYASSLPVFFRCCKNNTTCTTLIFDIENEHLMNDAQNSELFELDQIQKNLKNGIIPLGLYDVEDSFDICNYFGTDSLTQESTNLAAVGAERAVPFLEKNAASLVSVSLKGGKALGLIEAVNPAALVSSVVCLADSSKVKVILEKLGKCSSYLKNIQANVALQNYRVELNRCNVEVREELNKYVDSTWGVVKGSIDTIGNGLTGVISYLSDLTKTPSSNPQLKIAESEYNQLKRIRDTIERRKASFTFPDTSSLVSQQNARMSFIIRGSDSTLSELSTQAEKVSNSRPADFKIVLVDFFFEPNYNLTEADEYIRQADGLIAAGRANYNRYRFNSAVKDVTEIRRLYSAADKLIQRENTTERRIDGRVILGILTALAFALIVIKKRENPESVL